MATPETPWPSHWVTSWRYAASVDWAVSGTRGGASAAAISASAGRGRVSSSQPFSQANSRKRAALARPIKPERAISRSESP
jgi:hypothetical protein